MASVNVTLTKDATTVAVPGPPSATTVRGPDRYVTGSTADGTRYSYKTNADAKELWTIVLSGLSLAQRQALHAFFHDVAGGPSSVWDYAHTDGVTYEGVRFVTTRLEWTRESQSMWGTSFVIETPGPVNPPAEPDPDPEEE